jgi:hypothetical protein
MTKIGCGTDFVVEGECSCCRCFLLSLILLFSVERVVEILICPYLKTANHGDDDSADDWVAVEWKRLWCW